MCAAYKSDKKAIPVYVILFAGNVGKLFPTNYLILYSKSDVMMGVSDVLDTFVGMWEYKKVLKKIYICKNFF